MKQEVWCTKRLSPHVSEPLRPPKKQTKCQESKKDNRTKSHILGKVSASKPPTKGRKTICTTPIPHYAPDTPTPLVCDPWLDILDSVRFLCNGPLHCRKVEKRSRTYDCMPVHVCSQGIAHPHHSWKARGETHTQFLQLAPHEPPIDTDRVYRAGAKSKLTNWPHQTLSSVAITKYSHV